MFDQMEDDDYGQIRDLSLPKHLNHHIVDSSVYDVEVSGIRDLLANRSKRTGRKTMMKSQPLEQEFRSRASLVFRDAQNETANLKPMTAPTPKEKSQRKEQKLKILYQRIANDLFQQMCLHLSMVLQNQVQSKNY